MKNRLKYTLGAALSLAVAGCGSQGGSTLVNASGSVADTASAEAVADSARSTSNSNVVQSNQPTMERPATPACAPVKEAAGFCLVTDYVPDAVLDIRYYGSENFIGRPIDGYEQPVALITVEAAKALQGVAKELADKGYRIKVYDAYRPQRAVDMFMRWAADPTDTVKKQSYYPTLAKTQLIPGGYIARRSGHSRGSTIDLTLVDKDGNEVDMGGTFDFFGELSHPSYPVGGKNGMKPITQQQYNNRQLLRTVMMAHGFKPISSEWWHFTLRNEPYPNTYFKFPVNAGVLGR